jgi:hypothetical protein
MDRRTILKLLGLSPFPIWWPFQLHAQEKIFEPIGEVEAFANHQSRICYAPDYFGGNSINYPTLLNG